MSRLTNGEIFVFDKWLQSGIQFSKTKFSMKFDAAYSSADIVQFVFPIQNNTNTLLGSFISSNDKSGRKYPFIISTPINNSFDQENTHLIPLAFKEFYQYSGNIICNMKDSNSLDDIIDEIKSKLNFSELNLSQKKIQYQEYINITTANIFWSRLFGNFDDDRKYLLFYNLRAILLPFRDKQINNFTLGLKIPIISDSEFIFPNISFWIDVCLKFVDNTNILPYLFWFINSRTEEKYLILFLNQPPHDNYAHLINPQYLMDNICLTEKEGNIEKCMLSLEDKYRTLLEQKEISLAEFLRQI